MMTTHWLSLNDQHLDKYYALETIYNREERKPAFAQPDA